MTQSIVSRDAKFMSKDKELPPKNSSKKTNLSNLELVDSDGNSYSTYIGDYFMMDDKQKFKGNRLVATQYKNGWTRKVVLKRNPTKKDLKIWNKKLYGHEDRIYANQ